MMSLGHLLRIPEIKMFLDNPDSHEAETSKYSLEIMQLKDKIKKASGHSDEDKDVFDNIDPWIYTKIEEDIKERNNYAYYLIGVYVQICNIETEIEVYNSEYQAIEVGHDVEEGQSTGNSHMVEAYNNVMSNYMFGLANRELRNFSSINTSLKFMRKLFSKKNRAIVSKELFENLTNDQKKDLKSFKKFKFSKLVSDKTIVNYSRMPQLRSILSNLRIVFFEDENYNVKAQIIFKDKPKTAM